MNQTNGECSVHVQAEGTAAQIGPPHRRLVVGACIVFLVTLSVSLASIATNRQLGYLGGAAEEYFSLGWNLYQTGTIYPRTPSVNTVFFGSGAVPVFRPPLYPWFVCGVLKLWPGTFVKEKTYADRVAYLRDMAPALHAVYVGQALLIAVSSAVVFLWLTLVAGRPISLITAILFGTNPYVVAHVGLLNYSILHIALLCASGYLTTLAFLRPPGRGRDCWMFACGLAWGVTTLARPTTLILPAFVCAALMVVDRARPIKALLRTAAMALGMAVVIAPYTFRNALVTGRPVIVNVQSGAVLWAATYRALPRDPNHYRWGSIWVDEGEEVYREVTGDSAYTYHGFVEHVFELDSAYRARALHNFRRSPATYLHNAAVHFFTFVVDLNTVYVRLFQAAQRLPGGVPGRWLQTGHPQRFGRDAPAAAFAVWTMLVSLGAAAGAVLAILRQRTVALSILCVPLCLAAAHAITYMDFMYYYQKMPFLFLFSGIALHGAAQRLAPLSVGRVAIPGWACVGVPVAVLGSLLSLWVLFY